MRNLIAAVLLSLAGSAHAVTCSNIAWNLKPATEAERVACVESDGSGGGRLKVSSLTLNGVDYDFPAADGTNGQQLTTSGSGALSWGAGGGGGAGHTISTGNATTSGSDFPARTNLQFSSTFFSLTDVVGQDMTFVDLAAANGDTQVWQVVETSEAVSDASITFSGLVPGEKYKVLVDVTQNTSDGYYWLRFNGDSGNNYQMHALAYNSAGGGGSYSHNAREWCAMSGAGTPNDFVDAGSGFNGTSECKTDPSDSTVVLCHSRNAHKTVTGYGSHAEAGCRYDGASGLSSITVGPSAGTMTGTLKLLKLDTITAAVANGETVNKVWQEVEVRDFTAASDFTFSNLTPGVAYRVRYNMVDPSASPGSYIRLQVSGDGSNHRYVVHGADSGGGSSDTGTTSAASMELTASSPPNNPYVEAFHGWIETQPSTTTNRTGITGFAGMRDESPGDMWAYHMQGEYFGGPLTSLRIFIQAGSMTGRATLEKLDTVRAVVGGAHEITETWGVVETQTVSGVSDVSLSTVFEPGARYQIIVRGKNTTDTSMGLRFNGESGMIYTLASMQYHSSTPNQVWTNTGWYNSNNSLNDGAEFDFVYEFATTPSDNSIVRGFLKAAGEQVSANPQVSIVAIEVDLAAALSAASFINTAGTFDAEIKVLKLGPAWVATFDTEVNGTLDWQCPSGFTAIEQGDNFLGCMQNAENGTTGWDAAAAACFTAHGGRLPDNSEWLVAMTNYSLTDEVDDWEWISDIMGLADNHGIIGQTLITNQNSNSDGTSYDYRCWIPNPEAVVTAGTAISVPASSMTIIPANNITTNKFGVCHATVTLTTSGGTVDVFSEGSMSCANISSTLDCGWSFLMDGEFQDSLTVDKGVAAFGTAASNMAMDVTGAYRLENVSAGAHDFCWTVQGLNGNVAWPATAGALTTQMRFGVREIRTTAGTGDVASNAVSTTMSGDFTVDGDLKGGVSCPSGFTEIASQGRTLGCMQTAEESSANWNTAQDDCFDDYGGRLPFFAEWFVACQNFSLTAELDDQEYLSDGTDSDNVLVTGTGNCYDTSNAGMAGSVAYRCWIPAAAMLAK